MSKEWRGVDKIKGKRLISVTTLCPESGCWRKVYKAKGAPLRPCQFRRREGHLTCKFHHQYEDMARTYATEDQLLYLRQEQLAMDGTTQHTSGTCRGCGKYTCGCKVYHSVTQVDDVVYITRAMWCKHCKDCTVHIIENTPEKSTDYHALSWINNPKVSRRRGQEGDYKNSRQSAQHQEEQEDGGTPSASSADDQGLQAESDRV